MKLMSVKKQWLLLFAPLLGQLALAVDIEFVPVCRQWRLDCGAHAFKNARLGLDLIDNEGREEVEDRIRKQLKDYTEYKKQIEFINKSNLDWFNTRGVGHAEMQKYIDDNDLSDRIFIFDTEILGNGELQKDWWVTISKNALAALADSDYTRSFVISTGGYHWIACTIKKINGRVQRVISMNSSGRSAYYNIFVRYVGKRLKKNWLTEAEAVQKVVDLASDPNLAARRDQFKRSENFQTMADAIEKTFVVGESRFCHNFMMVGYQPDLSMQDLSKEVDVFIAKFKEYVETLPLHHGDNNNIHHWPEEDLPKHSYSRIEFLEAFLSESSWWDRTDLFYRNFAFPVRLSVVFTSEEKEQIVRDLEINRLLSAAREELAETRE